MARDWSKYKDTPSSEEEISRWGKYKDKPESRPDWKDVFKESLKQREPSIGMQSSFEAGRPMAASVARLGESIFNLAPWAEEKLFSGPSRLFGRVNLGSKELDIPENEKTPFDKFLGMTPELGLGTVAGPARFLKQGGELLSEAPLIGKYLKTLLQQRPIQEGATQAAIASGFAPEGEKAKAAMVAGGLGSLGSKVAGAVEEGKGPLNYFINKIKEFKNPEQYAINKALKGVPESGYEKVVEASERLGIPVTPGEASGNPYAIAQQLRTGKSPEGGQKLIDFAQERAKTEKNIIDDFFKNIFNPKTEKAERQALYDIAETKHVGLSPELPSPELVKLQNDPVFQKAVKNMETGPHKELYQKRLEGVKPNDIKYLNQVKKSLGEMEQGAPYELKSGYGDVRREITDVTDKWAETYKPGRAIAEREIAERNLKKAFDKKEFTAENLANAIRGEESYKKLHFNLRNAEKAQKQLEDMKLVFDRIQPIKGIDIAKKIIKGDEKPLRTQAYNYLKEALGSHRYDKAMADLITNPKWSNELTRLKKVSDKEKLAGELLNLLGKINAQTFSQ